jgi:hypothetical protein
VELPFGFFIPVKFKRDMNCRLRIGSNYRIVPRIFTQGLETGTVLNLRLSASERNTAGFRIEHRIRLWQLTACGFLFLPRHAIKKFEAIAVSSHLSFGCTGFDSRPFKYLTYMR